MADIQRLHRVEVWTLPDWATTATWACSCGGGPAGTYPTFEDAARAAAAHLDPEYAADCATERAATVAWLRTHQRGGDWMANAIERGEHRG